MVCSRMKFTFTLPFTFTFTLPFTFTFTLLFTFTFTLPFTFTFTLPFTFTFTLPFTFTFTLPFPVLRLYYNLWLIIKKISAFSYHVWSRMASSMGSEQLSFGCCIFQSFTCSNNVQQQRLRKVCRLKCHHLPGSCSLSAVRVENSHEFQLATFSYIMEHSGCHHCFIWWKFWIEIRTEYTGLSYHYFVHMMQKTTFFSFCGLY